MLAALLCAALAAPAAAPADVDVPQCEVYGTKKGAVAGLMQIEAGSPSAKSFDGRVAAFWLADDRARTCRGYGTLKLLDKLLNSYELVLEPKQCLLLVDLGPKRAVLRDGTGACAQALCGGVMQLDGVALPRDKGKKPCRALRH